MNKLFNKKGIPLIESQCFICNSEKAEIFTRKIRYDDNKIVLKCTDCGLIYLEPPFPNEESNRYYENEYRKSYEAPQAEDYYNSQLEVSRQRLNFIKYHLKKEDSIIEIGSAAGSFLSTLKENGFNNISGIEPDKNYSKYAIKEQNLNIFQNSFEECNIPENSCNVILHYHVLEHTKDPIMFLRKIYSHLKPGGKTIFEIPNIDDYLISLLNLESFKNYYFQPAHNFYFSPKTVTKTLENAGFRNIKIKCIQRHSYLNGINWIKISKPTGISGGNQLNFIQKNVNFIFSSLLKSIQKSDTLVIIATK